MKKDNIYQPIKNGFTLIEVLVASAILVLLAFGFLGLQYIISQNQVTVWRDYLSIDSANSALNTIIKELRNIQESENGSYPLEKAEDQEIIFYSDYDNDGKVERIRYTLSDSNLLKGVIKPTGIPATYPIANEKTKIISEIIRNESEPIFFYYNSNWPEDTVNNPLIQSERISKTRLIKIVLKANPRKSDSRNNYLLESATNIRVFLTD